MRGDPRDVARRRDRIVEDLRDLVRDAEAWNRLHPDEEPIVIDVDLTADVSEGIADRREPNT